MKNRPHAADLLAIAHEVFSTEILPVTSGHKRYTALMIANAMAIARREIEAGDAAARAEYECLSALLGATVQPLQGGDLSHALVEHNRQLANEIRAGRYDDDRALFEHLRRTTEDKLAISNPKALKRA